MAKMQRLSPKSYDLWHAACEGDQPHDRSIRRDQAVQTVVIAYNGVASGKYRGNIQGEVSADALFGGH